MDVTVDEGGWVRARRLDMSPKELSALTRADVQVQASLDLHGYTVDESTVQLRKFIEACYVRGLRTVAVVSGKGLHSEMGFSVVKDKIIRLLSDGVVSKWVLAFASAHPRLGGTGVLIIKLVRQRHTKRG